jgi:hypothetical protein
MVADAWLLEKIDGRERTQDDTLVGELDIKVLSEAGRVIVPDRLQHGRWQRLGMRSSQEFRGV